VEQYVGHPVVPGENIDACVAQLNPFETITCVALSPMPLMTSRTGPAPRLRTNAPVGTFQEALVQPQGVSAVPELPARALEARVPRATVTERARASRAMVTSTMRALLHQSIQPVMSALPSVARGRVQNQNGQFLN
jgi:hypothetical protein